MCSYSIWWLLIQRDWYYYQGDLAYLKEQKDYLTGLLRLLISKVGDDGVEKLDGGGRFLDCRPVKIRLPSMPACKP